MNTLNGIFQSPKPPLKNYLAENKKKIRQMSSKSKRSPSSSNSKGSSTRQSSVSRLKKQLPDQVADGAEYPHVRPQLFVQCRNQASQTEEDIPSERIPPYPSADVLEHIQTIESSGNLESSEPKRNTDHKTHEESSNKKSSAIDSSTRSSSNRQSRVRYRKVASKPVEIVDPHCPPGHVALAENERLVMLEKLKDSYRSKLNELNRLPVRADTLRIKMKKIELDKELGVIEDGIKIFGKEKIYVKSED